MMRSSIALVIAPTRMQGLLAKWGTKGAARFRMRQANLHAMGKSAVQSAAIIESEADFKEYESEDSRYMRTVESVKQEIDIGFPISVVERRYLPNYDFRGVVAVVVVGQDGLVANTAKYATDTPIIGVNPDPQHIDGILVPFGETGVRKVLRDTIANKAHVREVSLAQASTTDGQKMLAFNDLFIGRRSHASARYTLNVGNRAEDQSSSGIIVSTGAGSTGWLSSVFNMTAAVSQWNDKEASTPPRMNWEDRQLAWVVREPFLSKHSKIGLVAGMLDQNDKLVMDSLMPESGVVFSDGIETDFLEFNSGTKITVRLAEQRAALVVPKY